MLFWVSNWGPRLDCKALGCPYDHMPPPHSQLLLQAERKLPALCSKTPRKSCNIRRRKVQGDGSVGTCGCYQHEDRSEFPESIKTSRFAHNPSVWGCGARSPDGLPGLACSRFSERLSQRNKAESDSTGHLMFSSPTQRAHQPHTYKCACARTPLIHMHAYTVIP